MRLATEVQRDRDRKTIYSQINYKRMIYLQQYVLLIFDVFHLFQSNDIGHHQYFHGAIFVVCLVQTQAHTSKCTGTYFSKGTAKRNKNKNYV